jgi:hypothetical protein
MTRPRAIMHARTGKPPFLQTRMGSRADDLISRDRGEPTKIELVKREPLIRWETAPHE